PGVDFRHPDFVDAAGRSRLLYYWDTQTEFRPGRGRPGPLKYPNGTPVGTLYTRDDLTALLAGNDPQAGPQDAGGHGTACAGVAAGTGALRAELAKTDLRLRDFDYTGVAPE